MPDRGELMEAVLSRVRERFQGPEAAQVQEFVRQYYRWIPDDDLSGRDAEDLYGAAINHWTFARRRRSEEASLRIYTPRFEEHGWSSAHTVVEIVNDDMPFLVDSVSMALGRRSHGIHMILHPVVAVRRSDDGVLREVLPPGHEGADLLLESYIHVEIDRHTDPVALREIEQDLKETLARVRLAVEDWLPMKERLHHLVSSLQGSPPPVGPEEVSESVAFLQWLVEDNFIFLGYREYDLISDEGGDALEAVEGSGLGILRGRDSKKRSLSRLTPEARALARKPYLLTLTKTRSRAPVHRPAHMDYIGIKKFDDNGEVSGEHRFLGLYTTTAYGEDPSEVPLLRRKASNILGRSGFPPGSHHAKELMDVLQGYPRDLLFQVPEDDLLQITMSITYLHERQRVRLFAWRDTFGRFVSCLVYVPRDRYNTTTRMRIQRILQEELHSESVEFRVRLSESVLARLHFVIYTGPQTIPDYDPRELERKIVEATRGWEEQLYSELVEQLGEERGVELLDRYENAFPAGYRDDFSPRTAVADILSIEELQDELPTTRLYFPLEAPEGNLRFKIFCASGPIPLSGVLPLLENMGVRVIDEGGPYEISREDGRLTWIHDFGLVHENGATLQRAEAKDLFQEAFIRTWRGEAENDGFNRLVLGAGLRWREAAMLRAICKYLRQAGTTFSQTYMEETLVENHEISHLLVELFHSRFCTGQHSEEDKSLLEHLEEQLDAVPSLDQDRILRSFLEVILATLRTSYYTGAQDRLSFKLDPAGISGLPQPLPAYEVFVYSPRTEGVHLRGGKVARGGIRWSDRREDFRTEVLGLMKAQMVKNAVIIPVGAKGGFVVKRPPTTRAALAQEGRECYKIFIRGLLDLTDNLVEGEVIPPPDMVRYDGDDPYLVVAADKGTATFSDIANEISREYGFWLDDAFASGGSTGYDHKKMGITARGAWESVKRHFRELGLDPRTDEFTTVGIGDMSGDVFGNGMLLSDRIKLLAAFDHRHIFLDPDPDPQSSFAERRRLFDLPRSSWDDYDRDLISEGGGIFPRTAKSITLSPQIREKLSIEARHLRPNELIRELLKAPVHLLWNGGIGTYVKASGETNAEVGDRANDAVRIDGCELRALVVGEGGNLGLTQRGRIEYALSGGRINTDAVDNSAGVDCSDHEVNIKILLNGVVADEEMTMKQRNRLLAGMEEEVARLVLHDNEEQNRTLSLAVAQSFSMVNVYSRYLDHLERSGHLDRALEALPDGRALGERRSGGEGLTSPEYCVLMAYTKILLHDAILDSDLCEDPYLCRELEDYFPTPLRERFQERIHEHRLAPEITATRLVNELVNRGGISLAFRLEEDTGAPVDDILRAYAAARGVFHLLDLQHSIEAMDRNLSPDLQTQLLLSVRRLGERSARWLLRNRRSPLDIEATIAQLSPGVHELSEALPSILPEVHRRRLEEEQQQLTTAGVAPELAAHAGGLDTKLCALDIVEVARSTGCDIAHTGEAYFAIGERLGLGWLRGRIDALPRNDRWQTLARSALRDDLYEQQAALAARLADESGQDSDVQAHLGSWAERNHARVQRLLEVLEDIRTTEDYDLSTLSVALRELRNLSTGA